jgi:DNA-binding NtrC family response regulator
MRHVLYYDPISEHTTLQELSKLNGDWVIHPFSSPKDALSISQNHKIQVGLVRFPNQIEESILRQVENMINMKMKVKWIALLDRTLLENQSVSRIIANGFFDYLSLPLDDHRLVYALGHAWGMAEIGLAEEAEATESPDLEMVGTSPPMRALFGLIRRFAQVDIPVLVTGETGTGKELVSRAIHDHSSRAKFAFVAVNCGALPQNLIQSELFGHEKGAFTGAHQQRIGRIEAASGGTVFLDEIGDLPVELQINLLRFLQEKTFERVGGTKSLTADVRVIAATNVNLEKAVREGRFREDLFYRLNVLHVHLPPLRERQHDIELLAKFFFEKFSNERKASVVKGFSQQAMKCILEHDWPGNVRELINRIRRAIVMCENKFILPSDLGLEEKETGVNPPDLKSIRGANEKEAILETLEKTNFNISKCAASLGISRVTLYNLIRKYGIEVQRKKSPR